VVDEASVPCSDIFDSGTMFQLGTDPDCVWTTSSLLMVAFGRGPTILPADELVLLEGALAPCSLASSPRTSTVLQDPIEPQKPNVYIRGAAYVSECAPIVSLQAVASGTGSRTMIYHWILPFPSEGIATNSSFLELRYDDLPAGSPRPSLVLLVPS
jgi:hypothetical protein